MQPKKPLSLRRTHLKSDNAGQHIFDFRNNFIDKFHKSGFDSPGFRKRMPKCKLTYYQKRVIEFERESDLYKEYTPSQEYKKGQSFGYFELLHGNIVENLYISGENGCIFFYIPKISFNIALEQIYVSYFARVRTIIENKIFPDQNYLYLIEKILREYQGCTFNCGEYLMRQGNPVHHTYILIEGEVYLERDINLPNIKIPGFREHPICQTFMKKKVNGRPINLLLLKEGNCFGFESFFRKIEQKNSYEGDVYHSDFDGNFEANKGSINSEELSLSRGLNRVSNLKKKDHSRLELIDSIDGLEKSQYSIKVKSDVCKLIRLPAAINYDMMKKSSKLEKKLRLYCKDFINQYEDQEKEYKKVNKKAKNIQFTTKNDKKKNELQIEEEEEAAHTYKQVFGDHILNPFTINSPKILAKTKQIITKNSNFISRVKNNAKGAINFETKRSSSIKQIVKNIQLIRNSVGDQVKQEKTFRIELYAKRQKEFMKLQIGQAMNNKNNKKRKKIKKVITTRSRDVSRFRKNRSNTSSGNEFKRSHLDIVREQLFSSKNVNESGEKEANTMMSKRRKYQRQKRMKLRSRSQPFKNFERLNEKNEKFMIDNSESVLIKDYDEMETPKKAEKPAQVITKRLFNSIQGLNPGSPRLLEKNYLSQSTTIKTRPQSSITQSKLASSLLNIHEKYPQNIYSRIRASSAKRASHKSNVFLTNHKQNLFRKPRIHSSKAAFQTSSKRNKRSQSKLNYRRPCSAIVNDRVLEMRSSTKLRSILGI